MSSIVTKSVLRSAGLQNFCNHSRQFHSIQDNNKHTWSVLKHIYQRQMKQANKKYACLLLNISDESYDLFDKYKYIWNDSDLKVAVDGSADCLAKRNAIHTIDVISGDFDSIDGKLIERLQSPKKAIKPPPGTKDSSTEMKLPLVVETACQKETDFTKAIRVVKGLTSDIKIFFGLYYSDGTRIDHLFGLVNTLHLIKRDVYILNVKSNTVSWLLHPGSHTILKPFGQEPCSLVPFLGPTDTKTHGLRYNVNSSMTFGGLVSTSNICAEQRDKISVETNRELLWSIDLNQQQIVGHNEK